jgi:hypothetical protein
MKFQLNHKLKTLQDESSLESEDMQIKGEMKIFVEEVERICMFL